VDVTQGKKRHLADAYCFEGFRPAAGKVRGIFGKPQARILPLKRRSKKHVAANVAIYTVGGMTGSSSWCEMCPAETRTYTWNLNSGAWTAGYAVK
jgi:hypothetical protein